ncbi:MAG: type IV toxin-antitoxin system AbiEi family antitoxin domain-containing protein [Sulfurimonas sp.]|uniref:type IV toxin-antitoxin system AbiEi family antitoxin domain-containing protein n=1 Tax=Sulfurimonas sp. TaxID=2022749 RepID=UPI00262AB55D|nr:type IV toxin-antitoxin system AbiEi family antitoxin domain-containing protein [Sulfurimonas sp.]MDD2653077.1 type IV toxin-antitoxin system AbiEi family antitoxin domain-containing protein [Sulfurimonas sp.]MDD3452500.1 type IV toxin-antitoxin system AbiEi family antitoxin domain-containing protein [Sulfurimonas sp.]
MNLQNDIKIKQLYQMLPESVVAPASWLAEQGYSMQLLYRYTKSGWLKKTSRGSYIRGDAKPSWQGAVLGLQKLSHEPFHIGGITSLNLQGYAHYLPLNDSQTIYLYGTQKLPAWFKNIELEQEFCIMKKPYFESKGLKSIPSNIKDWEMVVSSPERAIMELLYQVKPNGLSFEFAAEIFEGLTTLRPSLVNELLTMCENIRVKRLFLFLTSYFNHPWSKHIKTDGLELGTGRMQIVKNGVFDNKFLITIPKEYHAR